MKLVHHESSIGWFGIPAPKKGGLVLEWTTGGSRLAFFAVRKKFNKEMCKKIRP
jgi:hypothetical protein